ncbi:MAG: hypothetical protein V3V55_04895 [Rhodospirillales bacterium]
MSAPKWLGAIFLIVFSFFAIIFTSIGIFIVIAYVLFGLRGDEEHVVVMLVFPMIVPVMIVGYCLLIRTPPNLLKFGLSYKGLVQAYWDDSKKLGNLLRKMWGEEWPSQDDVRWLQGHLGDLIALEFSGLEKVPENNSVTYIQGEVNHVGRFEVAYFEANRSSSPIRPSNSAIFRSLSRAATMANSAASEWA